VITLILPHFFNAIASSGYGNRHIRRFCSDYGMPITIIALTGFAYWGRFNPYVPSSSPFPSSAFILIMPLLREGLTDDRFVNEENMTLPTNSVSFQAENARSWLVRFWELPGKWVGIAFPFGFVLWILFYFDHNVSVSLLSSGPRPLFLYPLVRLPAPIPLKSRLVLSLGCAMSLPTLTLTLQSLIAQGSEFPLRKPPGFHWDFFLLGFVLFASGILGLPASNGV